jgi:tricorn protease
MMKRLLPLLLCCCLYSLAVAQQNDLYFAEHPSLSPDASTLYFSYDGDIWQVPAQGGQALRITAMDGVETRPRVSPDGRWLAFSSNQYGNMDVFMLPVSGGEIRRLTWHEAADDVECWSWDSQSIIFTSNRHNRMGTFSVSATGGTPQRLFEHYFNTTHNIAIHPISKAYYFNESSESAGMLHRKRYKGAYNPNIKSWHPETGTFTVHTDYEGKDFGTVIDRQGQVYFLSDEYNGEYNLYTFREGVKTRLTEFASSMRQLSVSADGSTLAFQLNYQLYRYEVSTGQSSVINISLGSHNTLGQEQDFNTQGNISHFHVSGDGKKMAFVSRGELFVSDIKGKFVRQLPTAAMGRVVEAFWLKDDKTILYNQTVDGYLNWFSIAADGSSPEKQHTFDRRNNRDLNLNAGRTTAVYLSGRDELRLLDLSTFKSTVLVRDEFWAIQNDVPQFGPDERHILFTAYRNFERDVFVVDSQTGKLHNLTATAITEAGPQWAPDGKSVFFHTHRTKPAYPYGLQDPDIYRMPLSPTDQQPFRSREFDALFISDTTKVPPTVSIVETDLMKYIEQLGPTLGSQYLLQVSAKDKQTILLIQSNHDEGKQALWKITLSPFEKPKTEKIVEADNGVSQIVKADGKYYALIGGHIHNLDMSALKAEKTEIKHLFRRRLADEFRQMFYETWANLEENFYDEQFHGVDWPAMRARYAAYLPFVRKRADLRRLTNDMLGELNTSHIGFNSSGEEETLFFKTRTLATGIIFDEKDPYLVKRLVKDSPAARSATPILPGDRLAMVNGQRIDPTRNREQYFALPSFDDEINLQLERNKTPVQVSLHPINMLQLRDLLYDEWMNACQQRVDERSEKRIAYVHMKNMGGAELDRFLHEMVAEGAYRDGLILDLRWNTGGNVHDEVLRFLAQKPYLQWKYREGKLTQQSNFGPAAKPIVLLINEQSLSDAEMTAQGFKELGLGQIIGTETYRWIIFTSGKSLVDGSFYRLPSWGCYTFDGKNLEMTGVAPDISIPNTFKDRMEGKDPQLDRAIEEIRKQLK